jgi:5,10-methylenetetrahydromethanopterin reductase
LGKVEYGVWLQPTGSVRELAEQARLCEELGFSFVGVTDGQMIWRDVYVALAAAALATRRVRLGPWVTNPITRHPTVTANAICTLDDLSDGRAFLGIGNGDDSVRTIGQKPARMDDLVESIELMRALAEGKQVETPHGTWTLSSARGRMPIYLAGSNKRTLEYAGRYTDGVVASAWLVPEILERMKGYALEGAASAGKQPEDVALIFNSCVAVDEDRERARSAARSYVARALCYGSSTWMSDWSEEDSQHFREQYDYYHHFRPDHDAAQLVPERMITRKAVAGSPEECVELLQIVEQSGFTHAALIPMGDVEKVLRLLAERVLPKL